MGTAVPGGRPTYWEVLSAMWTWLTSASTVIPTNMVTARNAIPSSVRAALRLLGRRNAGTPLLIASTPVSAVQPLAKARRISSTARTPVVLLVALMP